MSAAVRRRASDSVRRAMRAFSIREIINVQYRSDKKTLVDAICESMVNESFKIREKNSGKRMHLSAPLLGSRRSRSRQRRGQVHRHAEIMERNSPAAVLLKKVYT